jgi:hypothetical protein
MEDRPEPASMVRVPATTRTRNDEMGTPRATRAPKLETAALDAPVDGLEATPRLAVASGDGAPPRVLVPAGMVPPSAGRLRVHSRAQRPAA